MNLKITDQLANLVLNYLASKPYAEVFKLVEQLTKLEKLVDAKSDLKDINQK